MDNPQPTTPEKTSETRKPQSTPQSQGTAAYAEYLTDPRVSLVQNVKNIMVDLKDTVEVSFLELLKGLITRGKLGDEQVNADSINNLRNEVDNEFDAKLERAVTLCNLVDPLTAQLPMQSKKYSADRYCLEIKMYLKEYCELASETQRYIPLVNILNRILHWIHKGKSPVIFVVTDRVVIESSYHLETAKRKPDIILMGLEKFRFLCRLGNAEFLDCLGHACDPVFQEGKPTWLDILQFWELKFSATETECAKIMQSYDGDGKTQYNIPARRDKAPQKSRGPGMSIPAVVGQMSSGTTPVSMSGNDDSGRKRKLDAPEAGGSKKWRGGTATPTSLEPPPLGGNLNNRLPPDAQCAYYAIERFRASWKIPYVSGVLLQDTRLQVLWYDAQSPIRSSSLDILRELPLLLVLISVQQDMNTLTGLGDWEDVKDDDIPGEYKLIERVYPQFKLLGRMSSFGWVLPVSEATVISGSRYHTRASKPSKEDASHFMKVSWPEDDRMNEGDILGTAHERLKLLEERFREYVSNHIPDVVYDGYLPNTSTAIIRTILGRDTAGSRSQYVLVSKKLKSLDHLVGDFETFKKVFWEMIRCHRLLWVIGISHGDISFNNLMYDSDFGRGILNDFDLATVMKPGDENPERVGHRRTGTLIFMAEELLREDGLAGETARCYHHELESFLWILLWVALYDKALDDRHIHDWVNLTANDVHKEKIAFLFLFRDYLRGIRNTPYGVPLYASMSIYRSEKMRLDDLEETTDNAARILDNDLLPRFAQDAWNIEVEDWMTYTISSATQV